MLFRSSDREEVLTQRALLARGDRGLGLELGSYTDSLQILMLLSGAVLLIACVNIANVLLARFTARAYEIGVRLTLGASRRRLVQQFLVESALLSAMAAAAGLVLAFWMQRALVLLLMDDEARQAIQFTLNAHVLAFSGGAAIATLLLFGLCPRYVPRRLRRWLSCGKTRMELAGRVPFWRRDSSWSRSPHH